MFSLVCWNVHSIQSIRCFLPWLQNFEIICLQETWLKPNKNFSFPDFHVFRQDRLNRNGGGLITAIRSLSANDLNDVFEENNLLSYITEDIESSRSQANGNFESSQNIDVVDSSILNLLSDDGFYPLDIKIEPLSVESYSESSPSSSDCNGSSEMDVSSPNDPSASLDYQTQVIVNNTPPHTPPNITDDRTSSPTSLDGTTFIPVSSLYPLPLTNTSSNVQSLGTSYIPQQSIKNQVKIQPKPSSNGTCKSFILNSEQLSLLSNGTLRIKPAQKDASSIVPNVRILQPSNNSTVDGSKPLIKVEDAKQSRRDIHSIDLQALKRQQRMIKNRESACLSRKKKKEHLQKLEMEVKEMSSTNVRLQMENACLKQRICNLENENETLKTKILKLNEALSFKISSKSLKKTVGLMVVVFMLTLNLAPLSRLFERNVLSDNLPSLPSHHVGRNLLWEDETMELKRLQNQSLEFVKTGLVKTENISNFDFDDWDSFVNVTVCPTYINRTESQRLDNDLRGLVNQVEKKQKLKELAQYRFKSHQTLPPIPKLQLWMKKNKFERRYERVEEDDTNRGVMIYHSPRQAYEEFFDAIHRRDDTFYFVSFSGDHLLLPATVQNQTFRPRMSIVMPAINLNESVDNDDQVGMMQIDCEVMNTKLFYVKESAIPSHLRQKHNSTKANHSKKPTRYSSHRRNKIMEATSNKTYN